MTASATRSPPTRRRRLQRQFPRPAPATSRHANELVLRVLHAMSTDERVLVRLHDGGEHTGRITRRTKHGLVLDTGEEIPVARVCAITTAPLRPPAHDRDRRLAACVHTFGYLGHCLTKSRRYFYELRHCAATMLLERGMTPWDVAVQLGHQDGGRLAMSLYGHPSEVAARERLLAAWDQSPADVRAIRSGTSREQMP
jgi:hypothetical protein